MSKKVLIAIAILLFLLAGLAAALLYAYSPGLSFTRAHTGLALSSAKVIERRDPTFHSSQVVLEVSEGEAMLLTDQALARPERGIPFLTPPPELTSDALYLAGCLDESAWVGALHPNTRILVVEILAMGTRDAPPCPPGTER